METLNVISTPNIQGNIGSCKVEKTEYDSGTIRVGYILTNSCTGEVVAQKEYIHFGFFALCATLIILLAIIIKSK